MAAHASAAASTSCVSFVIQGCPDRALTYITRKCDLDMEIDLKSIALIAWQTIGTVAIPLVLAWIGKNLCEFRYRFSVSNAAGRAGGIAYDMMVQRRGEDPRKVREDAIAAGIDYLNLAVARPIWKLGLTPQVIRAMVIGELGKLLAIDPAVTIPFEKKLI